MTLDDKAYDIAVAQAALDREMLARLVREGTMRRTRGSYEMKRRGITDTFVDDIEERAFPRRVVNLAIRPKRKNGRR